MSIFQRCYQKLHQSITPDESFCLICLEPMETLCDDSILCTRCQKELHDHKQIYRIQEVDWYVYYEYNEFLERLFFRYKEQRDMALASVFLYPIKDRLKKWFSQYCVCGLCSSEIKRMERGFEPLQMIFSSLDIHMYSPLYKTENIKQSQMDADQRAIIQNVLKRKTQYYLPNRPICLVDDVCTTGASMEKAGALLHPEKVFVLAAHPLWIQKHTKNRVENKSWIC